MEIDKTDLLQTSRYCWLMVTVSCCQYKERRDIKMEKMNETGYI